jgi:poly-D-alanine transfer protein DltD
VLKGPEMDLAKRKRICLVIRKEWVVKEGVTEEAVMNMYLSKVRNIEYMRR